MHGVRVATLALSVNVESTFEAAILALKRLRPGCLLVVADFAVTACDIDEKTEKAHLPPPPDQESDAYPEEASEGDGQTEAFVNTPLRLGEGNNLAGQMKLDNGAIR